MVYFLSVISNCAHKYVVSLGDQTLFLAVLDLGQEFVLLYLRFCELFLCAWLILFEILHSRGTDVIFS